MRELIRAHIASEKEPLILIVEDSLESREALSEYLSLAGYRSLLAASAEEAEKILKSSVPDLILLDVGLPDANGFDFCEKIKRQSAFKQTPVIFLTAFSSKADVIRGFKVGGADYVSKPYDLDVLKARIDAQLAVKFSREELMKKTREINRVNQKLLALNKEKDELLKSINKDLTLAEKYIKALLPKPIKSGRVSAEWIFKPTRKLGGDSFGYKWLDEENFAMYILDVCHHGVASALLSATVLDAISRERLKKTNFFEPASALAALNANYQMPKYNDMFMSIWYGVFNAEERILSYASAGHPPAALFFDDNELTTLPANNILIGALENYEFKSSSVRIPSPSTLYLYTDGVYEIEKKDGEKIDLEKFLDELGKLRQERLKGRVKSELTEIYKNFRAFKGGPLADDFSILKFEF